VTPTSRPAAPLYFPPTQEFTVPRHQVSDSSLPVFTRRLLRFIVPAFVLIAALFTTLGGRVMLAAGSPPAPGDIVFNEYASDNDTNGNDFFELLVLRDNLDLRGLRVSDNETDTSGILNNNEAVFVFGQDDFLSNVPKGTLIAVYSLAAGVTTDTVVNPATNDWKMVLAPGTGVTTSTDGLGGSVNVGLATSGDALYLYLTGPDGTSAGSDNIYLDFISWEGGANGPPGLTSLDLPAPADNAYYVGNTAAGNDLAANWVRYDGAPVEGTTTPGDPNPGQGLSALRDGSITTRVIVAESNGSTGVLEGGPADSYTVQLGAAPAGPVHIQASSGPQTEVSLDGQTFGPTAVVVLNDASPAAIFVRAVDDSLIEGPMTAFITHSITASDDPAYSDLLTPVRTVTVAITDNDVPLTAIASIQGPGASSPLAGQSVTTRGIVTALRSNGFFIQEPDATVDGNPATSEGIFVFTSSTPRVARGDGVQVSATVSEFVPSSDLHQPPVTELVSPSVSIFSSNQPLPTPVEITAAITTAPDAVARLEALEGMRVSVASLVVVGPTLAGASNEAAATSTTSGVFYGVVNGVARPFREAGIDINDPLPQDAPCCIPRFDGNPERLRIDSDAQPGTLPLDLASGVIVTGLVGVMDYSFRTYTILPDSGSPTATAANVGYTAAAPATADEITVAGFNMERFFDTVNDPTVDDVTLTAAAFEKRLNKASLTFRQVLRLPDIVGVTEMENLSTLQTVADRINSDAVAAGEPDPSYSAYLVEGNDIGGIDVGFLVRSRVTVLNVRQEGKDTTFIDPTDQSVDLLNDRPPLILDARARRPDGSPFDFTVVLNHLRSLSAVDDPTDGPRVRAKRQAQAEYLASLIQDLQTSNPSARVMAIGDFNAFDVNDGYVDSIGTIRGVPTPADNVTLASADLVNPDLTDLVTWLPADQRYSYVFDGNAQVLDHSLVNAALLPWVSRFGYTRSNADFPDTTRNDGARPERLSDHDASITYLAIGSPRLSAQIIDQSDRLPSGLMTVTVRVTNEGGSNVRSVALDRVVPRTVAGFGPVNLLTDLPLDLGELASGQSATFSVAFHLHPGVVRFTVTARGEYTDADGARHRLSASTTIVPQRVH
jgi:predicted extracellular nuclease